MLTRVTSLFKALSGSHSAHSRRTRSRRSKSRRQPVGGENLETRALLAANFSEAFNGYAGEGFSPGAATAGTLDSNTWSARMSTSVAVDFGGTVAPT